MEKRQKTEDKIIFITKCVLVVFGLITAIPLANHLFRDIYKVACVWGFICVIFLFIKRRKNFWSKEYLLLTLFFCSYILTIMIGKSQHLINEIAMLGYTGVLFFVLTYCDKGLSKKDIEDELRVFSWILSIIPFVFSSIGILMFIFSISGKIRILGNVYTFGMFENRLWGLYNPNIGSVINLLSILTSVFLLRHTKKHKVFLWSNLILQLLCLILTQSRGTTVCALVFVVVYLFFVKKYNRDFSAGWKKLLYKITVVIGTCILMLGAETIVREGMAEIPVIVAKITGGSISDAIAESAKQGLDRLDKKENNINSISTGRSDMWKIGIDAFKDKPVLGIGFRSIDDVLVLKMTKGGYKNSAGGGLHNVYITVLVSSGIVGFAIIVLFLLIILLRVVRILCDPKEYQYVKLMSALIPSILVSELVESRIFFGMNIWAFAFWIIVGYVFFYTKKGEVVDNNNCTSV